MIFFFFFSSIRLSWSPWFDFWEEVIKHGDSVPVLRPPWANLHHTHGPHARVRVRDMWPTTPPVLLIARAPLASVTPRPSISTRHISGALDASSRPPYPITCWFATVCGPTVAHRVHPRDWPGPAYVGLLLWAGTVYLSSESSETDDTWSVCVRVMGVRAPSYTPVWWQWRIRRHWGVACCNAVHFLSLTYSRDLHARVSDHPIGSRHWPLVILPGASAWGWSLSHVVGAFPRHIQGSFHGRAPVICALISVRDVDTGFSDNSSVQRVIPMTITLFTRAYRGSSATPSLIYSRTSAGFD
jgi:hypothetical protein